MDRIKLAIHGAAGRMGRRLVALGSEARDLTVVAALERADHAELGRDAGELAGFGALDVPLSATLDVPVDAVIDFSSAPAVPHIVQICATKRIPLVLATTGLDEATQQQIQQAAQSIPVVMAPNMSLAVVLTMKLASVAAKALAGHSAGVDVEIVERHHRYKEDAPSGTALRFGEIIAESMGQTRSVHGREGRTGIRPSDEIGYHALRAGDHPGEHTIYFGMMGESVELAVRATSRDSYALGALEAARFVARQQPGIYSMNDVLGI
ncbi:MAG: 4-hydroxy-tetrahydrodipicolinate reductase [Planctomycetales bacterium]|nr:4-hydroxy-tetrahydrodipicolinate reductase [Planctomycetales bacterium]